MEHYVLVTRECNFRCSYCSSVAVLGRTPSQCLPEEQISKTVAHIRNHHGAGDRVVFFGGEPFLRTDLIERFMDEAAGLDLAYGVYTNGLLLPKVSRRIIDSIDVLFISADGDKESHDQHRRTTAGEATYDTIMCNLADFRRTPGPFVLGRITVEEQTNIYASVNNLLGLTDGVYWQVVSKPHFRDFGRFYSRYTSGICRLVELWVSTIETGKVLGIIPIQSVVSSLMYPTNRELPSFRCMAGSGLEVIDVTDGCIYWCDEYVGDKKGRIGVVGQTDRVDLRYQSHVDLFSDCVQCSASNVCKGRCRKCLSEYSTEQKRCYCELTKHLISEVTRQMGRIRAAITAAGFGAMDVYGSPRVTEEIP